MIVIVCIDENNGMMFNKRRQSRDKYLIEDILKTVGDGVLWMNRYSYEQFTDEKRHLKVCEDFIEQVSSGEYCFVENIDISPWKDDIEEVIVYRWNKKYPSDMKLGIPLNTGSWKLVRFLEFTGYSHEKITKEIYRK